MTIEHPELPPVDRAQSDDLNRLLDDLHRGLPAGDRTLDPALVATARAVASIGRVWMHGDQDDAVADALWHRLLGSGAHHDPAAVPRRRSSAGIVSSPLALQGSRGQPLAIMRVLAAVAAVAVLSLTVVSLYSELTGGRATPTVMAAGVEREATATAPPGNAVCSTETVVATSTVATATRSTVPRVARPVSPTMPPCAGDHPTGGTT